MSAIVLRGAGKRYTKFEDEPLLVSRALRIRSRTKRSELWALQPLDVTIDHGECVGVIGRNGSGKSTLLRLLAGVTAPTTGSVRVEGRLAPLIAVGVGFHPELTGRENVYVNGTILGLSTREIDERFDSIIDFAGIPEFVDTPVKFYSSGMFVRLGFAVAAAAEPDVLLVDEVLAVGDVAFQMRCYDRMVELRNAGTTIVVVSHNLMAIRNACERTLLLHDGELQHDGDTGESISLYHEGLRGDGGALGPGHAAVVERFELRGPDGAPTAHVDAHDDVAFRLVVRFHETVDDPIFGLAIVSDAGVNVYSDATPWRGAGRFEGGTVVTVDVRARLALPSGSYSALAGVRVAEGAAPLTPTPDPVDFFVNGRPRVTGAADLHAEFQVVTDAPRPTGCTLPTSP